MTIHQTILSGSRSDAQRRFSSPRQEKAGKRLFDYSASEKLNANGEPEAITPADVAAIKAFVDERRMLTTPFDIVVSGDTTGLDSAQRQEKMISWSEAGATWWIETMYNESEEAAADRVRLGPPA